MSQTTVSADTVVANAAAGSACAASVVPEVAPATTVQRGAQKSATATKGSIVLHKETGVATATGDAIEVVVTGGTDAADAGPAKESWLVSPKSRKGTG